MALVELVHNTVMERSGEPIGCQKVTGMVEMSDIQALAERIAREFNPERIILFGSYAHGTPGPDSDVDLLVVLPFAGKTWRVASEIRRRTRPIFPLDLLVRSPEQLRQRSGMTDAFMQEVVQEGRVLYEA